MAIATGAGVTLREILSSSRIFLATKEVILERHQPKEPDPFSEDNLAIQWLREAGQLE